MLNLLKHRPMDNPGVQLNQTNPERCSDDIEFKCRGDIVFNLCPLSNAGPTISWQSTLWQTLESHMGNLKL